jgi:hypothetical protein
MYARAETTEGGQARRQALAYQKAAPPTWAQLAREWRQLADNWRRRAEEYARDPGAPAFLVPFCERRLAAALARAPHARAEAARLWIPQWKRRCA